MRPDNIVCRGYGIIIIIIIIVNRLPVRLPHRLLVWNPTRIYLFFSTTLSTHGAYYTITYIYIYDTARYGFTVWRNKRRLYIRPGRVPGTYITQRVLYTSTHHTSYTYIVLFPPPPPHTRRATKTKYSLFKTPCVHVAHIICLALSRPDDL